MLIDRLNSRGIPTGGDLRKLHHKSSEYLKEKRG